MSRNINGRKLNVRIRFGGRVGVWMKSLFLGKTNFQRPWPAVRFMRNYTRRHRQIALARLCKSIADWVQLLRNRSELQCLFILASIRELLSKMSVVIGHQFALWLLSHLEKVMMAKKISLLIHKMISAQRMRQNDKWMAPLRETFTQFKLPRASPIVIFSASLKARVSEILGHSAENPNRTACDLQIFSFTSPLIIVNWKHIVGIRK